MTLRRRLLTVAFGAAALACQGEIAGSDLTSCPGGYCGPGLTTPGAYCAPCSEHADCAADGSYCVAVGAGMACGAAPVAGGCPDPSMRLVELFDEADDGSASLVGLQCVPVSESCSSFTASLTEAAGAVVLNEIFYNSPGTDTGSFLEIKGLPGTPLDGFRLAIFNSSSSNTANIDLGGRSIPASGYFVIAQDTTVAGADLINTAANLVNTAGSLRLEQNGQVVDALSYGSLANPLGEGTSAQNTSGSAFESLGRIVDGLDTNNNAADFGIQTPTPGAPNSAVPDPDPDPEPTEPKKVLFDLTKAEDAGDADWRIDGGYSQWAQELRDLGYVVEALTQGTIDASDLTGVSVFILPEPQNPLTDSERQAISSFVSAGGGLLLIGDHRISDRNNNGWDSPEVFNGWDGASPSNPAQSLRASLNADTLFALEFSFASSFSSPVFTATPRTTHPILEGVESAGVYVGTPVIARPGAVVLMGSGTRDFLAVSEIESGRVAAYGDSSAFSDGSFSGNQSSQRNNWTKLNNAKLAKNLVSWLAKDR